jgi:hypothetical protein
MLREHDVWLSGINTYLFTQLTALSESILSYIHKLQISLVYVDFQILIS